jgi:hypothetical protein
MPMNCMQASSDGELEGWLADLNSCTEAFKAACEANRRVSHGDDDLELVDDAIPLSQVWYCRAAADRKRRRFALAAEKITSTLGWVTREHTTGEDQFLLKTTTSGFRRERKFVFRCSRKKDSQHWSFAIRHQISRNALAASKVQKFQRFRDLVRLLVDSGPFQIFVALLILLNFLVSVFDTEYHPPPDSFTGQLLDDFDIVFTSLFAVECAMNMVGHYFWVWASDTWNIFDLVVVVASIVADLSQDFPNLTVLRTARVFRVIRLFKRLKALRAIVNAIAAAFWPVGNALFILGLVSFVYSILGVRLYADREPENFRTFTLALLSMIQTCTGEGWSIGRPLYENKGDWDSGAVVFFVSYLIIVSVILVNAVLAILVDEFIKSVTTEQANDAKHAEKLRIESVYGAKKHVAVLEPLLCELAATDSAAEMHRKIEDLFRCLDNDDSGYVNFHAMLFGLHRMTSVPNTEWDALGKIFFSRSSHKQFLGDLIIPHAGMDFEAFDYSIQTQLQMFLQRNLTESIFSTQDHGQRGLMFSMKQLKRNLTQSGSLHSLELLQNEMSPKLSHSSRPCTPCDTPPNQPPGLWTGDQGARWRNQSTAGSQGALTAPYGRMLQNHVLSKSPIDKSGKTNEASTNAYAVTRCEASEEDVAAGMEQMRCVARVETTVENSEIDASASAKDTTKDEMSNVMSTIIDGKFASLEARMMEKMGNLMQALIMLQEEQVRHSNFPTCRDK